MALARIEVLTGRTSTQKQQIIAAVRSALSDALKAPSEDPLVRLVEHQPGEMSLPYPDRHSEQFALIEITMFAGRTPATKRRLYEQIVTRLGETGVPARDILIVLNEQPMENWGLEGGTPASELDVGFQVEI